MRFICVVVEGAEQRRSPVRGERGQAFRIETQGRHLQFDTNRNGVILEP
jgi:hypothetical protein